MHLPKQAFFAYGLVSNANVGFTAALAWFTFSKRTGLSPLVPGQWRAFLAVYVGIYATLGTLLRPLRLAFAVGITPSFTAFVGNLQRRLPFYDTRRKLNRTLAIICISLMGNVLGTFAIIALGVWIASLASGVPAIPPGFMLGPGATV